MSTDASPRQDANVEPAPSRLGRKLYRINVQQYLKMIEIGIFARRGGVELLGGVVFQKHPDRKIPRSDEVDKVYTGPVPYRYTVRQLLAMAEAGILPPDARVELVGGLLLRKMTKFPPPSFAVLQLGNILRGLVGLDWLVSEEKAIELHPMSRPEPDLAVIRGPVDLYRARIPEPADVSFLVDVSDSSYGFDRQQKWPRYASADIPAYWIVHIQQRRIEVYTEPTGTGKTALYQQVDIYEESAKVPVVIDGQERGRFVVRDVLA